jgi:hypothetical protein
VPVDFAPSWLTPLHFTRLADERSTGLPATPKFLMTYGPFADDLVRAAEARAFTDADRLTGVLRSIGAEWIASFADELDSHPSPITGALRRDAGLATPGHPFPGLVLRRGPWPTLSRETISRFCANAGKQLESFCEYDLGWLIAPLRQAAESGDRPRATSDIREWLLDRLVLDRATITPATLAGRSVMTLEFPDLRQWVLYELVDIYESRPLIRQCRLCFRLFVPSRKGDTRCRRFRWERRPGGRAVLLERCVLTEVHEQDSHRREYKRLRQRAVREVERYGSEHPRALRALNEFEAWKGKHLRPRGPKPREVQPPVLRTDEDNVSMSSNPKGGEG